MPRSRQTHILTAFVALVGCSTAAFSQATMDITAPKVETPPAELLDVPDPNSPEMIEYRALQKRRIGLERQLKKIRATYFKNIRNIEIRQAGIERLRDFTDPASFPSMLDIFRREGDDVREAILDHLAAFNSDEADGTLAWTAVFDSEKKIRASATKRLEERLERSGQVSESVQSVVAMGLRNDRSNDELASAAHVANVLRLYDAIPMMVNAQAGGGGGGSSSGTGALAYIIVGSQQAYVSDLTPVIADSAVGFDPEISIITDGVVMSVQDAAVVTYHMDVYYSLVSLAEKGYGQRPPRLGFDHNKWNDWYADEFLPHRQEIELAEAKAAQSTDDLAKPVGGG